MKGNRQAKVLALFGPTACGKTEILLDLFSKGRIQGRGAEVVSADSVQVYRGMDVGSAKPLAQERDLLPHHLIDILEPHEQFDCGSFVRLASAACEDIISRGKLPVVSGGCGFYLKNLILGLPEAPPSDAGVRLKLKGELLEKGARALMEELAACDPVSASRIHINDEYRLTRALEVFRLCQKPLSSFGQAGSGRPPPYDFLIIGLSRSREELYRRVNERAKAMFEGGLASEVRGLFEKGYTPENSALRAIGYREFFVQDLSAGRGEWRLCEDLHGVRELVAQNSRRYAKRQAVFFASIPRVKWLDADQGATQTARAILKELDAFGI